MAIIILRLKGVLKRRGVSRSTHYLDISKKLFTQPVKIGERAVGWPESEVEVLNAARIAGKSANEIRNLVVQLEAARKDCEVTGSYEKLGNGDHTDRPTSGLGRLKVQTVDE